MSAYASRRRHSYITNIFKYGKRDVLCRMRIILLKIADVLDVSISDLLGAALPNDETQQNEIAAQLIRLNEQYAIRNRRSKRIWRVVLGVLVGLLALIVVGAVVFRVNFDSPTAQTTSQVVQDVEE